MDSLRLILIVLGAVLLVALYVWDRLSKRRRGRGGFESEPGDSADRFGPGIGSGAGPEDAGEWVGTPRVVRSALSTEEQQELEGLSDLLSEHTQTPAAAPESARSATPGRPGAPTADAEQVFALHVLAVEGERFAGSDLAPAFEAAGLVFGAMGIFHCPTAETEGAPAMFSVANMVEPGSFDPQHMSEFATAGLVLFMTLPNAARASVAYDRMLETARGLAEALGGTVRDERRCVLTAQAIERARERIHAYESKQARVKPGR